MFGPRLLFCVFCRAWRWASHHFSSPFEHCVPPRWAWNYFLLLPSASMRMCQAVNSLPGFCSTWFQWVTSLSSVMPYPRRTWKNTGFGIHFQNSGTNLNSDGEKTVQQVGGFLENFWSQLGPLVSYWRLRQNCASRISFCQSVDKVIYWICDSIQAYRTVHPYPGFVMTKIQPKSNQNPELVGWPTNAGF